MAENNVAPDRPNTTSQFELIPTPASADLAAGGAWLQPGFGGNEGAVGGVDLWRFLHALRRRWLVAAIISLPISAAAAFAFWSFLPRNYTTTAILRMASSESTLIYDTADSNKGNANTFDVYKRTQRQLLRSRFVATRALRDNSLANLPVFQNEPDPVGWLETNLSVTFPDESEVMYVSLAAGRPDGLDQLVNAVVEAYFAEIVFAERDQKLKRLNSLDVACKKAETELRSKRTEFKQLVDRVGTGDTNTLTLQQKNSVEKYAAVQQQSIKVRFDLMQAEAELEFRQASENAKDQDVDISEEEVLLAMRTDQKSQALKAEKQRILDLIKLTKGRMKEGTGATRLDDHTRGLEICEEKIESRTQELRQELIEHRRQSDAAGAEALKRKIAHLTAQDKQLKSNLAELEAETRHVGKSSIDVEMMRTEIALLQDAFTRLGAELEHSRVELQPDSKSSWARVNKLSDAEPARHMDSKGRITKIIMGAFAWMVLPVVALVWLDARKGHVNSGAEISQGLGLSIIGAVPLVPERVMRRLGGSSAKQQYWRTLLSESVDSIAAVLMRGGKREGIGVVMVSSATSGEGKTTLAGNLATSLAGAGRRTVLVDFDLRRPALHRVFDLALEPGINDVLRDLNELPAMIQWTQVPNLAFLAAGRWSATGLGGLAAADLKALFARLRAEFEFVVVDGSPILPVVDTRLIAQNVDTVVISVLRDTSRLSQVRSACELLQRFAVPIFGVVVTGSKGDAYPDSTYGQYLDAKAV